MAMESEKYIFESFLKTHGDFAGEAVQEWDVVEEWYGKRRLEPPAAPFDKRPDIICRTNSGKTIGVELKSWLNEVQIADRKARERIEVNILRALGEQGDNKTRHIGLVWLSPKQVRFAAREAATFREQVLALIERADGEWAQKPKWEQECSDDLDDLTAYPIADKYLHRMRLFSAARTRFDIHWIGFPAPGGAYDPKEMLGPLEASLLALRDDERYKDICGRVGLDEVYLALSATRFQVRRCKGVEGNPKVCTIETMDEIRQFFAEREVGPSIAFTNSVATRC